MTGEFRKENALVTERVHILLFFHRYIPIQVCHHRQFGNEFFLPEALKADL
jgi:hypothetical protein